MATYTVDTTADTVDAGDGQLSLREALAFADVDPATADTIVFDASVQGGTITLAGSELTVASDVTIDGGAGVTIDAQQASRILSVRPNEVTSITVALDHLTITGGQSSGSGGGVVGYGDIFISSSTLAISHSTISNCGAAYAGGGVSGFLVQLTDSTVVGNRSGSGAGGGVSGFGVELTRSAVVGNSSGGGGGGVFGAAGVTLADATVTGNTSVGSGGGVNTGYTRFGPGGVTLVNSTVDGNHAGSGGGIHTGILSLTNSTIANNGAEVGGGAIVGSQLSLTSSTVAYNAASRVGGGFYLGQGLGGGFQAVNSIVAGNVGAGGGPDVAGRYGDRGVTVSNGLNVFGSDVAGSAPGDREGVPAGVLFGGGLADNGGPTRTIALLDDPANPALGRADPALAPAADQRGEARPQPDDTHPDVGAFELDQSNPIPPPVPTTFVVTSTGDVSADDGVLTLREALALANADSTSPDRIEFAPEVQGQTIVLGGSQLTVGADVTVDGGVGVTVDANGASRVLLVQGLGTDALVQHVTITGGRTTGDADGGGGIFIDRPATLTLDHVTVSGNETTGQSASGGGISGVYGSVTLTNSTVSGNRTVGNYADGGGIVGDVTLTNSTVSGNETFGRGGGIIGGATLTNSTVSGNRTTGDYGTGGGIYGSATLTNSTVSGNRTIGNHASGGGIYGNGAVMLTNSTVSGNSTAGRHADGGGIHAYEVTPSNSIIAGNITENVRAQDPDVHGTITSSNGHNIFGGDVTGDAPGDLENIPVGRLFAGLADNGGPTQTIALRDAADNPALAGADPTSSPAIDQRGEVRPQPPGTAPDIGAFELDQTGGGLNEIVGTSHDNFLRGTAGADLMRGLGGDDRLWGRPGDDTQFGDAGRDVLAGKAGIDAMTGGGGADQFLFRHAADAPATGPGYDEILDFSRAQGDEIDLRPIDAKSGLPGNQAFCFVGDDAFTRAGQLRHEATADGDFLVSGNVDRDLDADFAFIVRTGLEHLRANDFLL